METPPLTFDFSKKYYLPARPYGFALFRLYFRLNVSGLDHVPDTGPVLLVPNHTSFLDPPLLSSILPRVIYFLMLHTHYYHPMFHWLFSRLPCIPMKRAGASMTAMKYCLQALHHDQVLCIFPEGGISRHHKARGARHGAALLAARTQAPLVPVGIHGASEALPLHRRVPRPKPIQINIGHPIHVDPAAATDKTRLQEIIEHTMTQVHSLVNQ
ncbi:hypothetical protein GF339_23690 [candidate division KSB3 bacterium]|uniref:Phospholipid/glycerol acyltransferase domain-containing protein n=1 Tax=candidate division KSB3 bacterium TaxID=2044937 RepID=A0A9D5K1P2_9BACT|nr:hypothetical protein [candidate division KSB3 bacterium]MBD3327607.1 hypothetical protein [candidate division KSB3 bacterium]